MPAPLQYDVDTIIAAVQAFIAREGRPPQRQEFTPAHGLPSLRLVERRMGTWQEPIRQAMEEQP
jgi:hypothetical protein